jgi:hypothetical protein
VLKRREIGLVKAQIRAILFFIIILMTFCAFSQISQTSTLKEEKMFIGYFNQTRLTSKFGIWTDLHYRSINDFIKEPHQGMLRGALIGYINDNLRVMGGYTFVYNYSNSKREFSQIEHRPWQQIFLRTHYNRMLTIQMLRLEQRYLQVISKGKATDEFIYTNRIRYNYLFVIPFSHKGIATGTLSGVLNNEVFINFGKNVRANIFDQNRFFAGFAYQFNKQTAIHVGYMNILQQLQTGNDLVKSNCIRIFLFQNLDFRKQHESTKQ